MDFSRFFKELFFPEETEEASAVLLVISHVKGVLDGLPHVIKFEPKAVSVELFFFKEIQPGYSVEVDRDSVREYINLVPVFLGYY